MQTDLFTPEPTAAPAVPLIAWDANGLPQAGRDGYELDLCYYDTHRPCCQMFGDCSRESGNTMWSFRVTSAKGSLDVWACPECGKESIR